MKILNGNICCINLDEVVEKVGRVIVPTKDKSYKRLKVVKLSDISREEGVLVGLAAHGSAQFFVLIGLCL